MKLTLEALGTHLWITLPAGTPEAFRSELLNLIKEFENNYSRFEPSSYVGTLNDSKKLNNPPNELKNMLQFALDTYDASGGIFNISIGSKLENSGYGKSHDSNSKVSNNLRKDIIINDDSIKLSKHTRIDLGGFGKGWLVEKLAGWLAYKGMQEFLINGGGDITAQGKPFEILIEHPVDKSQYIGKIMLNNESLASSSNIKRTWEKNGTKHAHIIHPQNKKLDDILSIHVLAKSILMADTFATIFMLVPHEERVKLAINYGLEFMEVLPNMQVFKSPGFKFQANS